jgi:hypothetical protein
MQTIDLTDDEHAAVTAAIKRAIEEDRFPSAPRLDPLRSALAKLDPAAAAALRRPQTAKTAKPTPHTAHTPKRPPTSLLKAARRATSLCGKRPDRVPVAEGRGSEWRGPAAAPIAEG